MSRLVALALVGLLAAPAAASNPKHSQKQQARPAQTVEPPLARPMPPATPAPLVAGPVVEAVVFPHTLLSRLVADRLVGDPKLLREWDDLRQVREEMHRSWMNNQQSVLTYERLSRP